MPLHQGPHSQSYNIRELTHGPVGSARSKGIKTFARTHNISHAQARSEQAWIIAQNQKRKKTKPMPPGVGGLI